MKQKMSFRHLLFLLPFAGGLLLSLIASAESASQYAHNSYVPLVLKNHPMLSTLTPIPSFTRTLTRTPVKPSATPLPTRTLTRTATKTGTTGKIVIVSVFYHGTGSTEPNEYVEIQNKDTRAIQVQGWTLANVQNRVFTFPSYRIQPNQVCRVYTNRSVPAYCGFSYGSGSAIWNNTGDCAYLRDSFGVVKSQKCYGTPFP